MSNSVQGDGFWQQYLSVPKLHFKEMFPSVETQGKASSDSFHTVNKTLNGKRWSETPSWWRSKSLKSKPLGKATIQQRDTNYGREHAKMTSAITCEWHENAVESEGLRRVQKHYSAILKSKVGLHINRFYWLVCPDPRKMWGKKNAVRKKRENLMMSPSTEKQKGGALYYICQTHRQAGRQLWRQMNDATPSALREMRSDVDS